MDLVSYKEAIQQGLPKYFTGKPCKHGHVAERRVSGRCCIVCSKHIATSWAHNNILRTKEIRKNWDAKNRELTNARVKAYRENNPDKYKQSIKSWRDKNSTYYKGYMTIQANKRRASQLQRTPVWLNLGNFLEIESIYQYCAALRQSGLNYHVDHIIPLQGKTVSGLHVPWNLQVIHAAENMSKSNRMY